MALIADDPPMPRPRGIGTAVPVADCTVVVSPQLDSPVRSAGHAGGIALRGCGVAPPASSNNTRALVSSDSRAAMTQPALPAPTTTKS